MGTLEWAKQKRKNAQRNLDKAKANDADNIEALAVVVNHWNVIVKSLVITQTRIKMQDFLRDNQPERSSFRR